MAEMKVTAAPSNIATATGAQNLTWPVAVTLGFLAILWCEVVNHLRPEWSLNPQYGYGWSVPFLAIDLFWRRWLLRPAAAAPASSAIAVALMALCALLFFPIR